MWVAKGYQSFLSCSLPFNSFLPCTFSSYLFLLFLFFFISLSFWLSVNEIVTPPPPKKKNEEKVISGTLWVNLLKRKPEDKLVPELPLVHLRFICLPKYFILRRQHGEVIFRRDDNVNVLVTQLDKCTMDNMPLTLTMGWRSNEMIMPMTLTPTGGQVHHHHHHNHHHWCHHHHRFSILLIITDYLIYAARFLIVANLFARLFVDN